VVSRLPAPPGTAVLAGEGEFLAARVLGAVPWSGGCAVVRLGELLGPAVSQAACARAVAVLAAEAGS
jgi:hypothetical protein